MGALGGVGMRSGVPSLALGSSTNSVMHGKGRIVPGLSASLRCSNITATAAGGTGVCAGDGSASGDGRGTEVVGDITLT